MDGQSVFKQAIDQCAQLLKNKHDYDFNAIWKSEDEELRKGIEASLMDASNVNNVNHHIEDDNHNNNNEKIKKKKTPYRPQYKNSLSKKQYRSLISRSNIIKLHHEMKKKKKKKRMRYEKKGKCVYVLFNNNYIFFVYREGYRIRHYSIPSRSRDEA